jgi:hypothetical protein
MSTRPRSFLKQRRSFFSTLEGRADIRGARDVKAFDVFLSHNNVDTPAVEILAHKLQNAGLEPWPDTRCLASGRVSKLGLATAPRAYAPARYSLGQKIKFLFCYCSH